MKKKERKGKRLKKLRKYSEKTKDRDNERENGVKKNKRVRR